MPKSNHRIFIANILLSVTCYFLIAIAATAAPYKQLSRIEDDSIQKYFGAVQAKIQANWKPAKDKNTKTVCPIVRFMILPNGQVADLRIHHSSNNADMDSTAMKAVRTAAPFPPITISPYDKNGLPIEMNLSVNVFDSHSQTDINVSKIISQAHQSVDKSSLQSAADILSAGLMKYPNNARLKSELSSIYLDQATILIDKSPRSEVGIELAKKALSLDSNNTAAKSLIPDDGL